MGQAKAREQLEIFIGAAKKRAEALDHALLFGPPGLGKTTLAMIIASEMGAPLRMSSGPAIQHAGDLAALAGAGAVAEHEASAEAHRACRVLGCCGDGVVRRIDRP